MTSELQFGPNIFYQCDQCALLYRSPELAQKCEAWCGEHKSCNLEIIEHAVHGDPQTAVTQTKDIKE